MPAYGPNLLPTLTDYAAPECVVSASAEWLVGGTGAAWQASNADKDTYWFGHPVLQAGTWRVHFLNGARAVRKLTLKAYQDATGYYPKTWKLRGSNDDVLYVDLIDTANSSPDDTQDDVAHAYLSVDTTPYEYFEIVVTATSSADGGPSRAPVIAEITMHELLAPPTITVVAPDGGVLAGGTAVTITGTNFDSVSGITFGGVAATAVVTVGPTSLTCVTPAGSGLVDVVVTNGDTTTATLVGGYFYSDPAVPSDEPTVPGLGLRLGLGFAS